MDKSGDSVITDKDLPTPDQLAGRIDLWKLSIVGLQPPELSGLLSSDERLRADRFHFAKDRDRFIFMRGCLRIILGGYLELPPARIEFAYGRAGKPYLAHTINPHGLRFNLSHSGVLALVAVGWGGELGVDIEQIRPDINLREIAAQFFSRPEATEIFSMPEEDQPAAFFSCWTRKEAYVKAIGDGLSFPLHSFGVSVKPGGPATLNFVHGDEAAMRRWTVRDVSWAAGYPAALVAEGPVRELFLRNVNSELSAFSARGLKTNFSKLKVGGFYPAP